MTAEEMWALSGLQGPYEAWAFGDDADELARLVLIGRKTAAASAYPLYAIEGEPLPQAGEYSVILNGSDQAVCIIQTTRVTVLPFDQVPSSHAAREGEGDLSLAAWRRTHRAFFTREMAASGLSFADDTPVVCEEFLRVFPVSGACADAPSML